jgi:hypothetical protein
VTPADWERFGLVDAHRTRVDHHAGNPSWWVARCSCEWHGRAWLRQAEADDEAAEHEVMRAGLP